MNNPRGGRPFAFSHPTHLNRDALRNSQQLVTTLAADGEKLIDAATTAAVLEEARTSLLGQKSGELPELFKQLPSLCRRTSGAKRRLADQRRQGEDRRRAR